MSERKSSHDRGYDSDDSNGSFVSAHSTNSEPALDQEGSPKYMRSRKLKWLKTTMTQTAVKSVNYIPGAQCLPSYQRLPNKQSESDLSKRPVAVVRRSLDHTLDYGEDASASKTKRRGLQRVASAPAELVPQEDAEPAFYISKMCGGEPPFCNIIVSSKPSAKKIKIVRFIALQDVKKLPEDSARELTDFLSELLDPSQWPFEFMYDLRALPVPKLHMVVHLAKWGADAKRQEYFIKRCVGCRIILSPGMMFNIIKASCGAFFKVCPPTCNTYIMTEDVEPGPDAYFFPPPKALVEMREREAKKLENLKKARFNTEAEEVQYENWGFAECTVIRKSLRHRELRFEGSNAPIDNDAAERFLEWLAQQLDKADSENYKFSIVYDLRKLRVPKPHMFFHLAKWAADPVHKEAFKRRCVACKVIIVGGLRFPIIKATLATWFKFNPATCRTYLLEEDIEPGPESLHFDPPNASSNEVSPEASANGTDPSADEALSTEVNFGANPQDSEEDLVVRQPGICWSWIARPVQKVCGNSRGPSECFSFLSTPKRLTRPSEEADQLAQLTQTVIDQQKTIDVLTQRMSALEGTPG